MSGKSSNPGAWWSVLEPASQALFQGREDPEDQRLGEQSFRWTPGQGEPAIAREQPVLVGFPSDIGVTRNGGRPGAALAPDAIRRQLYRLVSLAEPPWTTGVGRRNPCTPLLDLGNVQVAASLEAAQASLGLVVAAVLGHGGVPIVLGGGHETAFGHYLGYAQARLPCAILNIDAHLDVRPFPQGGHSGSPFRQAFEHPQFPLGNGAYSVLGAQPQAVAAAHVRYVRDRGGTIHWVGGMPLGDLEAGQLSIDGVSSFVESYQSACERLAGAANRIMLTIDADAFRAADVPGVSAPNSAGLDGRLGTELAYWAGQDSRVCSLELVEVNPRFDLDDHSSRWAALVVWRFLAGLGRRNRDHVRFGPDNTNDIK